MCMICELTPEERKRAEGLACAMIQQAPDDKNQGVVFAALSTMIGEMIADDEEPVANQVALGKVKIDKLKHYIGVVIQARAEENAAGSARPN